MLLPRDTYTFRVNGGEFTATRYTRGGERRIRKNYALSLSLMGIIPDVLNSLDGNNLYNEALLYEVLISAPPHWWEQAKPDAGMNGTSKAVLTFEDVLTEEFEAVAREVTTWLASFRAVDTEGLSAASAADASRMETPLPIPPTLRGVAS